MSSSHPRPLSPMTDPPPTQAPLAASPPPPAISLPAELVLDIIKLSVSSATYDDHKERYASLKSYSLVCRAWRNLAQQELFRSIVLETVTADTARQLLEGSESSPQLLTETVSLRIGLADPGVRSAGGPLFGVLRACPQLTELWARNVRLEVCDLAPAFNTLNTLHFSAVVLEPRAGATLPPFPHLRLLTLNDSSMHPSTYERLSSSFPHLVQLHLGTSFLFNHPSSKAVASPVPFIHGLKVLSLRNFTAALPSPSIDGLSCCYPNFAHRAALFADMMPPSLRFLHLVEEPKYGTFQMLVASADRFARLKILVVPPVPLDEPDENVRALRAQCSRMGVELVFKGPTSGDPGFEREFWELGARIAGEKEW